MFAHGAWVLLSLLAFCVLGGGCLVTDDTACELSSSVSIWLFWFLPAGFLLGMGTASLLCREDGVWRRALITFACFAVADVLLLWANQYWFVDRYHRSSMIHVGIVAALAIAPIAWVVPKRPDSS